VLIASKKREKKGKEKKEPHPSQNWESVRTDNRWDRIRQVIIMEHGKGRKKGEEEKKGGEREIFGDFYVVSASDGRRASPWRS